MEKTHTSRQHHYSSLLRESTLKTLLDRFEGVQLGVPTRKLCGEIHTSYFLKRINAGLSYKTKKEPYYGGPLGTPGWTIMTDISLCGSDTEGIERFVKELEAHLSDNRWVEPTIHPYASPYRI